MQVVVRYVLGDYAGELKPEHRVVYYGVQELIAMALSKDKGKAADCLKERELMNMVD